MRLKCILSFAMIIFASGAINPAALAAAGQSGELTLVSDGKAAAAIVLPDNPVKAEKLAVAELNEHIELITGVSLPVRAESAPGGDGAKIYVGATRRAAGLGMAPDKLKEQERAVIFIPEGLILAGKDKEDRGEFQYAVTDKNSGLRTYACRTWPGWWEEKGTLDAVYEFLRERCGIRWFDFTEFGTEYTPSKTLRASRTDIRRQPSFFMRDVFTFRNPADYPESCLLWDKDKQKERFNQYMDMAFPSIAAKYPDAGSQERRALIGSRIHAYLLRNGNGGTGYFHPNHSLYDYYARFWKKDPRFPEAFESFEPDYFAKGYEKDEKPPQLCYTNPRVVSQVAKDAADWFDGRPFGTYKTSARGDKKWRELHETAPDYYPVVPMDNSSYCRCENCRAWYKSYSGDSYAENKGMHSDYIFNFVSQVAAKVKETHPGRKIGALAYAMYMEAPGKVKLEDNIIVMCCPVLRNVYDSARQMSDKKMLEDWSKSGAGIYLWLYYCFPLEWSARSGGAGWHVFPGFFADRLGGCFSGYKTLGCRGMYFNGFGQETEAYVTFALINDAGQDAGALVGEYFAKMYGPAGDSLLRFYRRAEDIYCDPDNYPAGLDRMRQTDAIAWGLLGGHDRMDELKKLMAEARDKIKTGSGIQKKRFELFDLSTLQYIEEGRKKFLKEKGTPPSPQPSRCPLLLRVPADGSPEKVDWNDAQALGVWKSDHNEYISSYPFAEAAHDGRFLYLRLTDRDSRKKPAAGKEITEGDHWRVSVLKKSGSGVSVSDLILIAPDRRNSGLKDNARVVSKNASDGWTVFLALPLSLAAEGQTVRLNLARVSPGMPTAELSPSAGGPDTREAFVALSLDRSNAGPSAPGDGNLAARWDFEGGGEVIADSSPARANNGVLRSDKPERAPGIFGSALDFSRRINCEYFDVPKWSGAGDEFTLSIWLKIKPVPGAALGRLTYTLLSGDGGSSVVIRDHLLQLKSAKPKMTLGSNRLLNPFEWTHAAVTVSGSGTQIYINGRPAGESKARFSLPPAGGLLRVGSAMTGQFHLQFRGSADNIEIRREALSPGEIMGLYKKGLDRTHANNKSDEKGKTQ